MACAFSEMELSEFVPFLRNDAPNPLPELKAAKHVGRKESNIWVTNKDVQINNNGQELTFEKSGYKSGYIWLDNSHAGCCCSIS